MQINPVVSIVIPVRNEGKRIQEAILSFINGRSRLFVMEFIIVDDASVDSCCDNLNFIGNEQNLAIVKVIRLNKWSGIPLARNIGATNATAPILVITDANVNAGIGWDIAVFREIKPYIALCATIADKNSDWRGYGCMLDQRSMGIKWLKTQRIFNGFVPVSPCTGTVIYKDLFMQLGGFDTAMPVYGAAEPEFSLRLWLYGAQIKNVTDLIFYHRFRPDEERKPFLEQINLVQVKNYLRFGMLYLSNDEITDLFAYWERLDPSVFYQAFSNLDQHEIMSRGNYLRQSLKYNLTWFTNLFHLKQANTFKNQLV